MRASAFARLATLSLALGPVLATDAGAQIRPLPASGAIIVDDGVRISGDVPAPHTLSPAEFATMPRASLTIDDHGKRARFDGVRLADLLVRAGLLLGDSLRGPRLATSIVIEARDGYRVVLAIAEVDSTFTGRTVLLADRRDGAPLDDADGPLRLIIEGDRRMGRNVRQVSAIRVVHAKPY